MARSLLFFSLLLLLILSTAYAHGGADHDGNSDADSEEKPNLRSGPLILVKIWCLIIVFVGTFIGGISPYFMKWNEGFLVLGTQFAGGVFLATALMHFLSDASETFEELTTVKYPFAFMLSCAGYLMTMLADSVISYVYGKKGNSSDIEYQVVAIPNLIILGLKSRAYAPNLGYGIASAVDFIGLTNLSGITFTYIMSFKYQPRYHQSESHGAVQNGKGSNNGRLPQSQDFNGSEHHNSGRPPVATAASLGDSILLIVALCFHSVFEGIAIGVAETKADAWKALWTVSLHKIFAAIAMGIALLRMIPDRPLLSCAAYAFAFAISSPIGVAIGIIIDATTQGEVADWIFAISMGLACGVFIYVSINHLLSKGYVPIKEVSVDTPHYKFLAVMFGVGVIAIVMIWDT